MNKYCNFPNIKLNVAGLFTHSDLIINLNKILYNKYQIEGIITEIYGSPDISWNGGRIISTGISNNFEFELNKVSNAGLRPVIIFSNPIITNEMLEDKNSNILLELGIKYNAKFIVSNEKLIHHIKTKYSKADIKVSLIKVALENGVNNLEYYKNLEQFFYNYVVHPDDNLNFNLLKKLDRNKVEILLNERCTQNCPNRVEHYVNLSQEQANGTSDLTKKNNFLNCCEFIPEIKQLSHNKKNISLSVEEVKKLYNLGFYNFKIQGRTDNLYAFCFDLLKYILVTDELNKFYPLFCFYIEKYLKKQS